MMRWTMRPARTTSRGPGAIAGKQSCRLAGRLTNASPPLTVVPWRVDPCRREVWPAAMRRRAAARGGAAVPRRSRAE